MFNKNWVEWSVPVSPFSKKGNDINLNYVLHNAWFVPRTASYHK